MGNKLQASQYLANLFKARSICRDFCRRYDRTLRSFGLRTNQLEIIDLLAHKGALSQGEVASAVGLQITTLSRTLKPLIDRNLIGESQGSNDRRRRILSVTQAGLALLGEVQNSDQLAAVEKFPLQLIE